MIPNFLSAFRIVSSIPIICLFSFNYYLSALTLFIIASLTDFFDGYIARKYSQESNFGSLLDLLADKLLISSLLIWFVFLTNSFVICISTILIIAREIAINSIRAHILSEDNNIEEIKPNLFGKIKTSIQMIAISSLFLFPLYDEIYLKAASYLLLFSALVTVLSLNSYLVNWKKSKMN